MDGCFLDGFFLMMVILLTLNKLKIDDHFADFEQVKNWSYSKNPLGETGCMSNFLGYLSMPPALHPGFSDLWRSPPALSSFLDCSGVQFFNSPPLHSQLSYLWLPTPHCAAPAWLTGHHAMPTVTSCFPPNPWLGKQRISLGLVSILSMCLCSHV